MKREYAERLIILRDFILNDVKDEQFTLRHYYRSIDDRG